MPAIPGIPPARFFIWLASSSSTRFATLHSPPLEPSLQHLLVLAGEDVGSCVCPRSVLAVSSSPVTMRRRPRLPRHGIHLPLQVFLQLPESRQHLLESADFIRFSGFVSLRKFFQACSMDRTIGSRSLPSACRTPARADAAARCNCLQFSTDAPPPAEHLARNGTDLFQRLASFDQFRERPLLGEK